ncbi:MAG: iron-sulfur cluster-binding protein [Planctomycetota bacterium]|jgi:dihydroorotate dehydrogenase electron transfer subunit
MSEGELPTEKGVFTAVVRSNRTIGPGFYRILLEFSDAGAKAFTGYKPGQFAQLDLTAAPLPPVQNIPEELQDKAQRQILLRRPFSFADLTIKGSHTLIEILYCVVGPASLRMTALSPGDTISVTGPLGRGFWVPEGKSIALLVGGGMGVGPLVHMAKILSQEHLDVTATALVGAKTFRALPFEAKLDEISQQIGFALGEFAQFSIESMVATDDGSAGFHGPVTQYMEKWIDESNLDKNKMVIYTCGPEPMLAKMSQIATKRNIDCQISTERLMACGIGLCQSCAVECKSDTGGESVYKLCCKDGPVFDSKEVIFKQEVNSTGQATNE